MSTAIIFGITGQDGAYLAELLLSKGLKVVGTSRDLVSADLSRLKKLGIVKDVELISLNAADVGGTKALIASTRPKEVYNLAGQSSVGASFEEPYQTIKSSVDGNMNILEAIRTTSPNSRFFSAGSGEIYGDCNGQLAREHSPLQPQSPYASGKAAAKLLVSSYREVFGLFAATGILFNHESPLRPDRFVTKKIAKAVARISMGSQERLLLGSLDVHRDWGWSPEYVKGMWCILQAPTAEDFILSSGRAHSLSEFLQAAFSCRGLNWSDHVDFDPTLVRKLESKWNAGDATRASKILGWRATTHMREIASRMVEAEVVAQNTLNGS